MCYMLFGSDLKANCGIVKVSEYNLRRLSEVPWSKALRVSIAPDLDHYPMYTERCN